MWCYGGYAGVLLVYACGAMDLVICAEARFEAQELSKNFSGDVRDAQCSDEGDSRAIRAEIGDKLDDVNHTIKVLLEAGMSSPELQALSRIGIDLKHAGHINMSLTFLGWFWWCLLGLSFHEVRGDQITKTQVFIVFSCFGWSALWLSCTKDRRAFASAAAGRIFAMIYMRVDLIIFCDMPNRSGLLGSILGVATFAISLLGPLRITHIPLVGRLLVSYLTTTNVCELIRRTDSPESEAITCEMVDLRPLAD